MKLIFSLLIALCLFATPKSQAACALQWSFSSAVGPATFDAFTRVQEMAESRKCDSILFLINTPGGNLQTTRMLVESILNSKIPVLCFVWPPGGHAGSAGSILLQACHVSGAAPATNIGAATPISVDGGTIPEDLRNKLIEDTKAWVKGLAKLRGRSETFAEDSIVHARSLDADAALKSKVIDIVAKNPEEFLKAANGRTVQVAGEQKIAIQSDTIETFDPGLRFTVLDFLTDPQFAYFIFMASLALLYVEFTHPGLIAPGVVGGLGLIVSLMSFQKLDAWWGGIALIFFGLSCLIAEAFIPSFGVLGIGGLAAFSIGSILLYDPLVIGTRLPYSTVFGIVGTVGGAMLVIAIILFRSRQRLHDRKSTVESGLIGVSGKVMSLESARKGMAMISGELWKIESDSELAVGVSVQVLKEDGMILKVQPVV